MEEEFDIIIVGCGLSGMTAAYEILKLDSSIKLYLLEAKGNVYNILQIICQNFTLKYIRHILFLLDRVGGRTLTSSIDIGGGKMEKFDLGGQWVASSQPDILEILQELNIETYAQFINGTKVMQVGTGNVIRTYKSDIPSLGSYWGVIELQLFIWKVIKFKDRVANFNTLEINPK